MKLDLLLCSALLGFSAVEAHRHRPRHGRFRSIFSSSSSSSSSSGSSSTTTESSSSSTRSESSFREDPRTDTGSVHGRFRFDSSSSEESAEEVVVVFPTCEDPFVQPDVVVIEVAEDVIDADNESRAVVAQNEEFKKAFVQDLMQKRGNDDFYDLSSDVVWGSWGKKWHQMESESDVEVVQAPVSVVEEVVEAPAVAAADEPVDAAVQVIDEEQA